MAPASSRRGLKPKSDSKANTRKRVLKRPRASSKFHGVSKLQDGARAKRFRAQQVMEGQHYDAGVWTDERDAALAIDRVRLYLGLEPLNFADVAVAAGPASPQELRRQATETSQRMLGPSSRFKGVIPGAKRGRWRAQLWVEDELIGLGAYERDDDAALAHDRGALYFGLEADLNILGAGVDPWSPAELRAWSCRLQTNARQYSGVDQDADTGRWRASVIAPQGKSFKILDVGTWDMSVEAARARDRANIYYVGDRAELNLPAERDELAPASAQVLRREARAQLKRSMSSARTWHEGTRQYICYQGKAMTIRGWAAELGMSHQGLRVRLASNCSLEAVVSRRRAIRSKPKTHRYRGCSLTISEWARKLGIPYAQLHSRVDVLGWPLAKAVSTPPMHQRGIGSFRGVQERGSRWAAYITHEGSRIYLGRHPSAVEAAHAYDRAARKLKGPHWTLNFPDRASGHPKR